MDRRAGGLPRDLRGAALQQLGALARRRQADGLGGLGGWGGSVGGGLGGLGGVGFGWGGGLGWGWEFLKREQVGHGFQAAYIVQQGTFF